MSTCPVIDLQITDRISDFVVAICKSKNLQFVIPNNQKFTLRMVYLPAGAILPKEVMKELDLLDEDGNGTLTGNDNNVVSSFNISGFHCDGFVYPMYYDNDLDVYTLNNQRFILGEDASKILGITFAGDE